MDTYPKNGQRNKVVFIFMMACAKVTNDFFSIFLLEAAFQPKNFAYNHDEIFSKSFVCVKAWRRTVEIGELIPILFTESE